MMTEIPYYNAIGDASALALLNEEIVAAKSFEWEGIAVVAILTGPIFLQSARNALKKRLEDELSEALGKSVIVTYDMDVFRKIKDDMSDEVKAELFRRAGDDSPAIGLRAGK